MKITERKKLQGRISISATSCGRGPDYVSLRIEDAASGIVILEAQISFEAWGSALCARAMQPCQMELANSENIGKFREIKTVALDLGKDNGLSNDKTFQKLARKAAKPFEVDGWEASIDSGWNHHRSVTDTSTGRRKYQTTFYRWVDTDPALLREQEERP